MLDQKHVTPADDHSNTHWPPPIGRTPLHWDFKLDQNVDKFGNFLLYYKNSSVTCVSEDVLGKNVKTF